MNDALRMDLADCGSPEALLGVILKHHPELPRRVPVKEIARSLGIIDFRDLEVDGFEGGLTADPEKSAGFILTKVGTHPRRKRFTIGHELGHFLIPTHQGTQQCTTRDLREIRRDTPYRRQEAEANRFSAGLLMPKPMFLKDMEALGSADVTHAKELSDLYDTSMEATVNRYAELTSDVCAFIFSKDGVVRYTRPSRNFPRLALGAGDRLSFACETSKAAANDASADWHEHAGAIWLRTEWGDRIPRVLEQCVVQGNGYRVTLLFIDASEIEKNEEHEDLEDRWHVGFGKRP
jgi:Zn-dependent peptidase ImmA (M78 family)